MSSAFLLAILVCVDLCFGGLSAEAYRQTKYPLTLQDESGAHVTIKEFPRRIVPGSPAIGEILTALGLQENIFDKTKWSDAGFSQIQPDLAFFFGNAKRNEIDQIRRRSVPIFFISPHSISELYASIRHVGRVCNRNNASDALISRIERQVRYAKLRGSSWSELPYARWIVLKSPSD